MLVLFDVDGTLVQNTGKQHLEALKEAVRIETGDVVHITLENGRLYVDSGNRRFTAEGMVDTSIVSSMLAGGESEADPRQVLHVQRLAGQVYRRMVGEEGVEGNVILGAVETLTALREHGVRLGLATGNTRVIARTKLSFFKLFSFFSCGAFSDRNADRSAVVAEAVNHARPGEQVWFVGDTPSDVTAGKSCGVPVVGVCSGAFGREELSGATFMAPSVGDKGFLQTLLGKSGVSTPVLQTR